MEGIFKQNKRGLLSTSEGKDVYVLTKKFQEEGRYEFEPNEVTGNSNTLTFHSCKNARFII